MQVYRFRSTARGITLIEACACLAIVSILIGSAIGPMGRFVDGRRLEGVASELTTFVHYARSEAVAHGDGVRLTLLRAPDGAHCTIVHTGPASACRCDAGGVAQCNAPDAELLRSHAWPGTPVSVDANVSSMHFEPVRGAVSPSGTLRVSLSDGREVRHVVSLFGRLRSCSPEARVSGYKAC